MDDLSKKILIELKDATKSYINDMNKIADAELGLFDLALRQQIKDLVSAASKLTFDINKIL